MKEIELAVKSFADGLRIFAKSLEALADQITVMGGVKPKRPVTPGKATAPKKPVSKSTPTKPRKSTPARKKVTPAKAKKPVSAPKKKASAKTSVETIYGIIARSKKGVSSAQLSAKTGYNAKKVANVIYKLKKRDQIQTVKKGVYVKK